MPIVSIGTYGWVGTTWDVVSTLPWEDDRIVGAARNALLF